MKYRLYREPKNENEELTNTSNKIHFEGSLNNFNGDYINLATLDSLPENVNRLRKTKFNQVKKKKF